MANDEDQLSEYEPRLRSFSNRLWSILEGAKSYRGDEKTAAEAEDDLDQVSDDDVFDLIDRFSRLKRMSHAGNAGISQSRQSNDERLIACRLIVGLF